MKVGDLVKLKTDIEHASGSLKKGLVGFVLSVGDPTPGYAVGSARVQFIGSAMTTCRWKELEIVSASR
jgi:hypothetical protein